MKKTLILLTAVVVVTLVGLVIIKVRQTDRTSGDSTSSWPSEEGVEDLALKDVEDILGCHPPGSVSHLQTDQLEEFPSGERHYWVVATLPRVDFLALADELKLVRKPDLLESWPQAFVREPSGFEDDDFDTIWDTSNTVNEDTYFTQIQESRQVVRIAMKYENGRFYFKKDIHEQK